MTDYNKIITTVNSITPDYQFIPDLNNTIVIDTSVKTIDEQVYFIVNSIKSNMKGKKNE